MTYRANKIRTRLIERLSEEWTVELDPYPYVCQDFEETGMRHTMPNGPDIWACGTFSPRPGYEQDRSKYEN